MGENFRGILIFGNSGSGKSTLARQYASRLGLEHLDLDSVAWNDTVPPTRKPLSESAVVIERFVAESRGWVIEGCYADLLRLVAGRASEMIFLNPGVEGCIANCRQRPWEPHKYESLAKQNENLEMLIDWIRQYPERDDEFSLVAHRRLFDEFLAKKTEYRSNDRDDCL